MYNNLLTIRDEKVEVPEVSVSSNDAEPKVPEVDFH